MFISNTETRSYQSCERKHYWAFGEGIVPKSTSGVALDRGIIGHAALEEYYKAKKLKRTRKTCEKKIKEVLEAAKVERPELEKEIGQLEFILPKYVEHYWDEEWKILEVEVQHEALMFEDVKYGMRLDLLVESNKKILLVDHKFLWDFFRQNEIDMNTQMMKYIKCLREDGIKVDHAILNQIRYRELKEWDVDKHFKRSKVDPPGKMVENVWLQQVSVAKQIAAKRRLPKTEHKAATTMSLDYKSCGMCSYRTLCSLDLQGYRSENSIARRDNYKDNQYGYSDPAEPKS